MTKRTGWISAAEFQNELSKDVGYLRMVQEKEKTRAELHRRLLQEQSSLRSDLMMVGVPVSSVWDLVKYKERYERAVPVLIKHLNFDYHPRIFEGIARSLARPWAREQAFDFVLDVLERNLKTESNVGEGLYVAISYMAAKEDVPLLIKLLRRRDLGPNRIFFLDAVKRLDRSLMPLVLNEFEQDPDLCVMVKDMKRNIMKNEKKKNNF